MTWWQWTLIILGPSLAVALLYPVCALHDHRNGPPRTLH